MIVLFLGYEWEYNFIIKGAIDIWLIFQIWLHSGIFLNFLNFSSL